MRSIEIGRKDDPEKLVRASYDINHQYEQIMRTSNRPEEIDRARWKIDEQWKLIRGYLDEFLPLSGRLRVAIPEDLPEIVARLPGCVNCFCSSVLDQATSDLQAELRSEGLVEPEQAARTIAVTIPSKGPLLFRTSLCPGYPLGPSPHQYFVAQKFSPDDDGGGSFFGCQVGTFWIDKNKTRRADCPVEW